ncbi:aminopeptidase [Ligilactobacillus aviarius]|uniref:Aminopeptidase n=1 Tax=Ligilactobacillus aviarius TaxID=1606 RepID=A0A510WQP7_9LACO|nr:aminopeptidase [Ligilactobacillus aviarius]KRM40035.1 aminopeptidase PepS [Ligilactobacillus aviarius subsp. aviarius DSM 20655]GEK41543.1 aminopeptidase [Ligilactobacillus aviarius]
MTIANFEEKLQKYAELIVKVGVNVQPGQEVVLYINVDQQHLAHLIVKEAYKAGAGKVMIKWSDTFAQREFLEHASDEFLENVPEFAKEEAQYIADHRCCRISVMSEDPGAFGGIDQKRVAAYQSANGKALMPVRQATQNNDLSWTVVAAASPAWAERVFPDLKGEAAVDRLWEEIFKTTRIDREDPIQAWKDHDAKLHEKEDWLNKEQFSALHYTSPRTDLTIGLPENHVWEGGGSKNAAGIEFMANMPTEECFTAPDNRRIDGYVTSTKPLSYAGNILENMKFTFKDGKVVEATAEKGQAVLDHLLETDEGVRSLGEVSLVPDPSPISQSGITFFNTLFDENASDHLALGAAYPFNVQGGTKMSKDQLKAKGINFSQAHVDFMVGSADMNIDGIKKDGTIVPVFRNGDWA